MKYEVTSTNTKKMLAESFKKSLTSKPFSKVTVSEIIRDCGVNRKTFYYHFEDINALLAWCLQEDFSDMTQRFPSGGDFRENLTLALDYVDSTPYILNCARDPLGLIECKKFLYKHYVPIIRQHLTALESTIDENMDSPNKDFIYSFGAYGLINLLLDQQNNLTPYRREELVDYIVNTYDYLFTLCFRNMK